MTTPARAASAVFAAAMTFAVVFSGVGWWTPTRVAIAVAAAGLGVLGVLMVVDGVIAGRKADA